MLKTDLTRNENDLLQILQLQQLNLKQNLPLAERSREGFLTMQHSLPVLKAMHDLAPSVVVRYDDQIVAYALTELKECRPLMPGLETMFALIETLDYKSIPIRLQRYYTMGQICVAKEFRGKGLFDLLYQKHREVFSERFDLFLTEISSSNTRSLQAHQRVGFETIAIHRDELDEWQLVLWDWKK